MIEIAESQMSINQLRKQGYTHYCSVCGQNYFEAHEKCFVCGADVADLETGWLVNNDGRQFRPVGG